MKHPIKTKQTASHLIIDLSSQGPSRLARNITRRKPFCEQHLVMPSKNCVVKAGVLYCVSGFLYPGLSGGQSCVRLEQRFVLCSCLLWPALVRTSMPHREL